MSAEHEHDHVDVSMGRMSVRIELGQFVVTSRAAYEWSADFVVEATGVGRDHDLERAVAQSFDQLHRIARGLEGTAKS